MMSYQNCGSSIKRHSQISSVDKPIVVEKRKTSIMPPVKNKVNLLSLDVLNGVLPPQVDEFPLANTNKKDVVNGERNYSVVVGQYGSNPQHPKLTITISDMANWFDELEGVSFDTEGHYLGFPSQENYNDKKDTSLFAVLIYDRFVIRLKGNGFTVNRLKEVFETLNTSPLGYDNSNTKTESAEIKRPLPTAPTLIDDRGNQSLAFLKCFFSSENIEGLQGNAAKIHLAKRKKALLADDQGDGFYIFGPGLLSYYTYPADNYSNEFIIKLDVKTTIKVYIHENASRSQLTADDIEVVTLSSTFDRGMIPLLAGKRIELLQESPLLNWFMDLLKKEIELRLVQPVLSSGLEPSTISELKKECSGLDFDELLEQI